MGAAVAARPPAALWERVRAEAAVTRQLPPVVGRVERRRRTERGGGFAGLLAGRRRFPPLLAAAAALLVAAVSVTALNLGLPDRSERPVDLVAAVLARPTPAGSSPPCPAGRDGPRWSCRASRDGPCSRPAGCRRRRRTGPTSSGWWTGPGRARPGWSRPAAGGVTRLLDGRVTGTEQVAMTVERRGGSARPTSEPVVVVDLEA